MAGFFTTFIGIIFHTFGSIDILSLKEYTYQYEGDVIVQATESNITLNSSQLVTGKTLVNTLRYTYDKDGKLTRKTITNAAGEQQVYTYSYADKENDDPVVTFSAGGKTVTSHSKVDSFGRKIFDELQLGSGFVSRQFSYHAGDVTDQHKESETLKSSPTTQLVSQIILSDGRTLNYEYDPEERITKVIDSIEGTTEYSYNSLGELFTETKNGEIVNKMIYTIHGNMTSKNGVAYTYGNNAWKDLLTKVGDQSIFYDDLGNPVSYLGHTLTWEKGRQLKTFDNIRYTYNANGIRTSKTVGNVKHTYTLDGTKILSESWNSNVLVPLYDNEENVCGILYNNTPYYFLKNLQGDIIAITNKNGSVVAKYSYDAWGVCTVTQDSSGCNIANINPFRYRSYYFDTETNLYYLQSRYYNPQVGQFLNADDARLLGYNANTDEYNLFSYCSNNPITNIDEIGFAKSEVKKYIKESWIAWILNKIGKKEYTVINIGKLGLNIKLILGWKVKNPKSKSNVKLTKNSFQASFKGGSLSLGWGGKLETKLGISISRHSVSFMRGIDWKKSYIAVTITYVAKDKKKEFYCQFYMSTTHILKLAVAVVVAGACVLLPALTPVCTKAFSLLAAGSKTFVPAMSTLFWAFQRVAA